MWHLVGATVMGEGPQVEAKTANTLTSPLSPSGASHWQNPLEATG